MMRAPVNPVPAPWSSAPRRSAAGWSTLRLLRTMRFAAVLLQLAFTLSVLSLVANEKAVGQCGEKARIFNCPSGDVVTQTYSCSVSG